jgi:hypothetical protein
MIYSELTAASVFYPRFQGQYLPVTENIQKIQADALEHAARLCGDRDRPRSDVVQTLLREAGALRTTIPS